MQRPRTADDVSVTQPPTVAGVAVPEHGPWEPLSLTETIMIFRGATFRWWVSGGRALELHLGRSWREHEDTDVGVPRPDLPGLQQVLSGWDIHVAAAGHIEPWAGQELHGELHENNLWCRRHPNAPWSLDVTISEGDGDAWIYRRDQRVRLPWGAAVLHTADGVPYLTPELQLLFKSKECREKDELDARQVIPELDAIRRRRLTRLLPANHPWHRLV
jgi:hypothetical protein